MSALRYKTIHHSAVSLTKAPIQLYAINRYHKEKWSSQSSLGWFVGYNYLLDGDGTITQTRREGEETIAQRGHNFDTVSICIAGDFDVETPTPKQMEVLKRWINERPNLELKLHRELQENRSCPGRYITHTWLDKLLSEPTISKEDEEKKLIDQYVGILDKLRKLLAQLLALRGG